MSEEKKEETNVGSSPAEGSGEVPGYMQDQAAKRQQSVEKSLQDIAADREKMNSYQRFGFFSIPYPAICGDQAYSRNAEYHHKIVDGQIKTEPRGIYTHVMRSGKSPDVYFSVEAPMSKEEMQKEKEFREEEKKKLFALVDKRRKKEDSKGPTFKYPGPQIMTGFYHEKADVPTQPLYKEENRFKHIGEDKRQVIIENRGIMTSPTKGLGNSLYPNDFFSFYFTPKEVTERCVAARNEEEKQKLIQLILLHCPMKI